MVKLVRAALPVPLRPFASPISSWSVFILRTWLILSIPNQAGMAAWSRSPKSTCPCSADLPTGRHATRTCPPPSASRAQSAACKGTGRQGAHRAGSRRSQVGRLRIRAPHDGVGGASIGHTAGHDPAWASVAAVRPGAGSSRSHGQARAWNDAHLASMGLSPVDALGTALAHFPRPWRLLQRERYSCQPWRHCSEVDEMSVNLNI